MIKKYSKLLLIFMPMLLLLVWVMILSCQLHSGKEVVIRIKGYDPVDLLSGHYIRYEIDWNKTDCTQFEGNICPKGDFKKILQDGYWGNNGRFYVSEKEAERLDKAVRDRDNVAEIVYSYQPGKSPYALRILINGEVFKSDK